MHDLLVTSFEIWPSWMARGVMEMHTWTASIAGISPTVPPVSTSHSLPRLLEFPFCGLPAIWVKKKTRSIWLKKKTRQTWLKNKKPGSKIKSPAQK